VCICIATPHNLIGERVPHAASTCKLLHAFDIKCVLALAAVRSHVLRFDPKFHAGSGAFLSLSLSLSLSIRLRSLAARCLFARSIETATSISGEGQHLCPRLAIAISRHRYGDSAQFILIVALALELHPPCPRKVSLRDYLVPAYFIGAFRWPFREDRIDSRARKIAIHWRVP